MKDQGTVTLFRLVRKRRDIWLSKGELHLTGSGLRGDPEWTGGVASPSSASSTG